MSKKNAKVEQGEATLKHLIQTAREMFSQRGYANVSTTEIVDASGVTRGALYHHFAGKEALFRAVVEDVQADIGAAILRAVDEVDDDWQKLIRGCEVFLRASLNQTVQQIVLLDAPSVLGPETWRKIDEEATTRLLEDQLETLKAQGIISVPSTRALAHMLAGAMNEAVLFMMREHDTDRALQDVMHVLTTMLESFRANSA